MPFEVSASKGIAPGQYSGQLLRVESDNGKFGPQRKWYFLVDVDGEGVEHMEYTSANVAPGSKAYRFLEGLLGRELSAGEMIDDPVGVTVLLTFEKKANGYSTVTAITPVVSPLQTEPGVPR